MQHKASFGLYIFCLVFFVACQNEASPPKEAIDPVLPAPQQKDYRISFDGDTAVYHMERFFQLEDNSKDYEKKGVTKIILQFPQLDSFSSPKVLDSVNAAIMSLVLQDAAGISRHETIDGYLKEFIQDYKIHKKEMKQVGLPYSSSWLFDLNIHLLLNTPRLMALKVHQVEFTGGAHANPWTTYVNIDLGSGHVLELNDLLLGDYESELLMVAESHFKKSRNLAPDTNLVDTNYEFSTGDFTLPDNFSLGSKGLHFHYNPYDLGPYAMGAISFSIPYRDLHAMLNPDVVALVAVD